MRGELSLVQKHSLRVERMRATLLVNEKACNLFIHQLMMHLPSIPLARVADIFQENPSKTLEEDTYYYSPDLKIGEKWAHSDF
jgi:hypothetical protein